MRTLKRRALLSLVLAAVAAGIVWRAQAAKKDPAAPAAESPAPFTNEELHSLYYADLGPKEIDVSAYPDKQKSNYQVFTQVCSQCHTLARAINSSPVSRTAWDYYVVKMRLRSRFKKGTGYNKDQAKRIVDFLVYDAQVRKVLHREEFDALTSTLERRFQQTIEERMRRLQEKTPPILTAPH